MLVKDGGKAVIVGGFQQVGHFMDNDVLKQVLGLFYQFRVQADMPRPGVATAPFGFHALQEIGGNRDVQFRLPLADQRGHNLVEQ